MAPNRSQELAPTTRIDRRNCKRVVPMEVLVLGLCRTGTKSTRIAMKELGYNDTYHMETPLIENPPDLQIWTEAIAAKVAGKGEFTKDNWDGLLGHCMAVTDIPCAVFAPELIAAYPNAKVILTNRDVDSWYRSVSETTLQNMLARPTWFGAIFRTDSWRHRTMSNALLDLMFAGDFPKNGKAAFRQHYDQVRHLMADRPQDLLEYEVKQGWAPLCKFLQKPIPEQDFPRVNDVEGFKVLIGSIEKYRTAKTMRTLAPMLFSLGALCVAVFWALKRLS